MCVCVCVCVCVRERDSRHLTNLRSRGFSLTMYLSPPSEDDAILSLSLILLSSSRAARLGAHKSSVFWHRALVVCSKNEGENFKMGREEREVGRCRGRGEWGGICQRDEEEPLLETSFTIASSRRCKHISLPNYSCDLGAHIYTIALT